MSMQQVLDMHYLCEQKKRRELTAEEQAEYEELKANGDFDQR